MSEYKDNKENYSQEFIDTVEDLDAFPLPDWWDETLDEEQEDKSEIGDDNNKKQNEDSK
jgi:hypothetical protein